MYVGPYHYFNSLEQYKNHMRNLKGNFVISTSQTQTKIHADKPNAIGSSHQHKNYYKYLPQNSNYTTCQNKNNPVWQMLDSFLSLSFVVILHSREDSVKAKLFINYLEEKGRKRKGRYQNLNMLRLQQHNYYGKEKKKSVMYVQTYFLFIRIKNLIKRNRKEKYQENARLQFQTFSYPWHMLSKLFTQKYTRVQHKIFKP